MTFGRTAFEWKGALNELLIGGIILGCSAFMGFIFGYAFQHTIPQTTYKICIIDEEKVNMIDFNDTYEVLNKEGEIYTVMFKER